MINAVRHFVAALALSTVPALAADWHLLSTEPENLVGQLSAVTEGKIREGDVQLADGQFAAFLAETADARSVAFVIGPADIAFAAGGDEIVIRTGRVSFVSTSVSAANPLRVRVPAAGSEQPALPLIAGVISIAAAASTADLSYMPASTEAALPGLLRGAAPNRKWVWTDGKLTDGGALASVESAYLDGRALASRAGIAAARRERRVAQRELVLNLLAVDTSAKVEAVEHALQTGELRIVNVTSTVQIISISAAQPQPGVTPSALAGRLQFPGDRSPARIATANESRNPARPTDGRGFGTGGFSLLGIQFFGGTGVVGPGALVAIPR